MPRLHTRPCAECAEPFEVTPGRGRPRLTCSGRCRARRHRRTARAERDLLREFERLVVDEGTEEQWLAYMDLTRTVPGFRETHDLALRRGFGLR